MAPSGKQAGALLSVNVRLPQDVVWQGRTVHTAVWKKPVTGPRMVRRLNIDGDGQGDLAGHGGEQRAVFVYQIESYQYWQERLSRDDFSHGQFGENFTVQGLADDQVCIGDRYQIGGAVFEVTQPRVTCFRTGIRLNDPQMPALLVSQHRPAPRRRCLPVRSARVHGRCVRRPGRRRYRRSPHPHRGLRRGIRADTRHRAVGRPPAAPARGPAGQRAPGLVRAQRSERTVGSRLRQLDRVRRGL